MDGKPAGIGRYTRELADRLARFENLTVTLLHCRPSRDPLYAGREILYNEVSGLPRWWLASMAARRVAARFDVVHEPAQLGLVVPMNAARVTTVHDLAPLVFPSGFGIWDRAVYRTVAPGIYRQNDGLICDSDSTFRDLSELRLSAGKICRVIPLAAGPEFAPSSDSEKLRVRAKYALPGEFFLFVGTLEPRKNVERLLQAHASLWAQNVHIPLVLVGRQGWRSSKIMRAIRTAEIAGRARWLDYCDARDLAPLYSACLAFVYPSIYEGFGLPPLEAMSCGAATITSNSSAMPEVVGDAAITVDPLDVGGICAAMAKLSGAQEREDLRRRGLQRAKRFSWDETAKQTVELYRAVIRHRDSE